MSSAFNPVLVSASAGAVAPRYAPRAGRKPTIPREDAHLFALVDARYHPALPATLAALPHTKHQTEALIDSVVELCKEFRKLAARATSKPGRPRGYVPPVFNDAYAVFQPWEQSHQLMDDQLEHNYECALLALDFLLGVFQHRYPAPEVKGATYIVTQGYGGDCVLLTVPEGATQKQFAGDVAAAKKIVQSVDEDNFVESLFFVLLSRRGYGVVHPVQSLELNDLLLMRSR